MVNTYKISLVNSFKMTTMKSTRPAKRCSLDWWGRRAPLLQRLVGLVSIIRSIIIVIIIVIMVTPMCQNGDIKLT